MGIRYIKKIAKSLKIESNGSEINTKKKLVLLQILKILFCFYKFFIYIH